jgi:hypothetical protein
MVKERPRRVVAAREPDDRVVGEHRQAGRVDIDRGDPGAGGGEGARPADASGCPVTSTVSPAGSVTVAVSLDGGPCYRRRRDRRDAASGRETGAI